MLESQCAQLKSDLGHSNGSILSCLDHVTTLLDFLPSLRYGPHLLQVEIAARYSNQKKPDRQGHSSCGASVLIQDQLGEVDPDARGSRGNDPAMTG
jgi:hypothetical protein